MPWSALLVSLLLVLAVLVVIIIVRQVFFKRKLWPRDRRSTIGSITAASTVVTEKYDESLKDTLLKHKAPRGDDRGGAENNGGKGSSKNVASKNDAHVFANDDLFKFLQEKQIREMASDDDQIGVNKSADFSRAEDTRGKIAPVDNHVAMDPKVPVAKRWSEPAVSPAIMRLVSPSPKLKPKNYILNISNSHDTNERHMSSFGKMTAYQDQNQSREESDIEELRNLSDMVVFTQSRVVASRLEQLNNNNKNNNNEDDDDGGDRRSEHSITDLERMRNVVNWLTSNASQENLYEFEEITAAPSEPNFVYNWNSYGILNTGNNMNRNKRPLLNRAAKQPSSMSLFPRVIKQKPDFFE